MKKTFPLIASNRAPERQVEYVKHRIKKYIDREKRKKLPEEILFWDFDCRIGDSEETLEVIFINEIRPMIDKIVLEGKESFHIEIFSKPGAKKRIQDKD